MGQGLVVVEVSSECVHSRNPHRSICPLQPQEQPPTELKVFGEESPCKDQSPTLKWAMASQHPTDYLLEFFVPTVLSLLSPPCDIHSVLGRERPPVSDRTMQHRLQIYPKRRHNRLGDGHTFK